MLRGLWTLTWLEVKIFAREPLGLFGSVGLPVLIFIFFARLTGARARLTRVPSVIGADLPILVSLLIVVSTLLSLVAIVAIYREGGILRRLRATPLRPVTILTAQVLVKVLFTAVTLAAMLLAGRRFFPIGGGVPIASFTVALLYCTVALLSLGFLIASLVPTARFAQPVGTLILYPMFALSGMFFPIESLPPMLRAIARVLPLTYVVSLLRGVWYGEGWTAHAADAAALALMFAVFVAAASKVFRWE